jgi:hypothetical protein
MTGKETNQEEKARPGENKADENMACEVCGKFGAHKFGDRFLCADCYQATGSCCSAEFERGGGE